MKKVMCFLMAASLLLFAGCEKEKDFPSENGLFTVSGDGHQVRFAPGNLEYDSTNGYSFAAHQYDYGGYFGWGTGSNPMLTSTDWHGYPSFDDWGSHIAGGWRTLSREEWQYVIWDRADASAKCGMATVCGVRGMVLLPDNFSGGTFHAGIGIHATYGWGTNVYDATSWSDMEDAGAVFLPAAGDRVGTDMIGVGMYGVFWSSTPDDEDDDCAYCMDFYELYVGCYDNDITDISGRRNGLSVRLVQDY